MIININKMIINLYSCKKSIKNWLIDLQILVIRILNWNKSYYNIIIRIKH